MVDKKIELLLKLVTSKTFNNYGFVINFELDNISKTKPTFNVKFKNPEKTSWTVNSLNIISILIIEDFCKFLSIKNFDFPKNWIINGIFMDGELLSGYNDYFLSEKVKNDLKNYLDSVEILERFPTQKGEVLISTKPYKYKMMVYKNDTGVLFEIYFKIKSITLNGELLEINNKKVMSYIAGYLNYESILDYEDDISGEIYGIVEDELNFRFSDDYVTSTLIFDQDKNNKKINNEVDYEKDDVVNILNQYLSKK